MKKFLFLTLTSFLFFSFQTMAQTIVDSGSCGENEGDCNWTLDDKGHLSITGSGQMKNYTYDGEGIAPWRGEITSVEISGITRIGAYAFTNNQKLTDIDIPSSVISIGDDAFVRTSLANVTLHEGLKTIGNWAFSNNNLTNITLPESLTYLGLTAFKNTDITSIVLPDSLSIQRIEKSALTGVRNIYCSEAKAQKCADWLETATEYLGSKGYIPLKDLATVKTYENTGNGYYADGKFYKNLGDIGTPNHMKKRIYSIDEAIKVTRKKNSVGIRYK